MGLKTHGSHRNVASSSPPLFGKLLSSARSMLAGRSVSSPVTDGIWHPTRSDIAAAAVQGITLARLMPYQYRVHRATPLVGAATYPTPGISLSYLDHRPYEFGDDPRSIDWGAYARTDNIMVKLYNKELAPSVDLAFDYSASLFTSRAKGVFAITLLFYLIASSQAAGANVRCYIIANDVAHSYIKEELFSFDPLLAPFGLNTIHLFDQVPFRADASVIVISDLLFPGDPTVALRVATKRGKRVTLLVPYCSRDLALPAVHLAEVLDCEDNAQAAPMPIGPQAAAQLQLAYHRHCALWQEASLLNGAFLARLNADEELPHALAAVGYHHHGYLGHQL